MFKYIPAALQFNVTSFSLDIYNLKIYNKKNHKHIIKTPTFVQERQHFYQKWKY